MFGETTVSRVKIGNHPIETTIYKWLFGVPGSDTIFAVHRISGFPGFSRCIFGADFFSMEKADSSFGGIICQIRILRIHDFSKRILEF